jgi:hypothetical protein
MHEFRRLRVVATDFSEDCGDVTARSHAIDRASTVVDASDGGATETVDAATAIDPATRPSQSHDRRSHVATGLRPGSIQNVMTS